MDETEGNSVMAIRLKLVFVGDIAVGKTTILHRLTESKFSEDYDVFEVK